MVGLSRPTDRTFLFERDPRDQILLPDREPTFQRQGEEHAASVHVAEQRENLFRLPTVALRKRLFPRGERFHAKNRDPRDSVSPEVVRKKRVIAQRAGTLRAVLPRFFFRTFPVLRDRTNGTHLARKLKRAFVFLRITCDRRSPSTVGQPCSREGKEGKEEEGERRREEEVDFASKLRSRKTREIVGRIARSDDRVTRGVRRNNDDGVPGKTRMSEWFAERAATRRHPRLDRDDVHEEQTVGKRRDETSSSKVEDERALDRRCGVLTRSAKRPALDE